MFPAGSHELIEGWLHEFCVLLDDACNVTTAHCHIPLYSARHVRKGQTATKLDHAQWVDRHHTSTSGSSSSVPPCQADVIVCVHINLHVEPLANLRNVQHQNAFYDNDVCWLYAPRLCSRSLVRRKIVHGHVYGLHGLKATTKKQGSSRPRKQCTAWKCMIHAGSPPVYLEPFQAVDHALRVKSIWVVKVVLCTEHGHNLSSASRMHDSASQRRADRQHRACDSRATFACSSGVSPR